MVFDYAIPRKWGKYSLTMTIVQSRRMSIWFGVIDIRNKDKEESFNKRNTLCYSFKTGHVVVSNKWGHQKNGKLKNGINVKMDVDMEKNSILWHTSDGRIAVASITKSLRKLTLVPYF